LWCFGFQHDAHYLRAKAQAKETKFTEMNRSGLCMWQVREKMLEQEHLNSAPNALDMPWEARLAEALLILHKADQAEGDVCTPGLALLFEDSAFAKLSATSARVKSAAAVAKRLQREHAAELAGQDLDLRTLRHC
jgi:hypothetical protein